MAVAGFTVAASACSLLVDTEGLREGSENGIVDGSSIDVVSSDASSDAVVVDDGGAAEVSTGGARYRAAVLDDKPLAYLRLGEANGATQAADEIGMTPGSVLGGAMFGQPALIRDEPNNTAMGIDGKGVVNLGSKFDFGGTTKFSIELWMRKGKLDGDYRYPFFKEQTGPGRRGYAFSNVNDAIAFERYAGGGGVFVVVSGVTEGRLVHLVATYDSVTVRFYVDGINVDSATDVRPIALSINEPALIGADDSTGNNGIFGTLDEVAVYDHVLAPDRVRLHYDLGH